MSPGSAGSPVVLPGPQLRALGQGARGDGEVHGVDLPLELGDVAASGAGRAGRSEPEAVEP